MICFSSLTVDVHVNVQDMVTAMVSTTHSWCQDNAVYIGNTLDFATQPESWSISAFPTGLSQRRAAPHFTDNHLHDASDSKGKPCAMTSWMGSYLSAGWKHWSLDPAWCSLQRWQFCPVASLWCCCLGVSSRSCWPGSICPAAAVAPAVGSESLRKPLLPRGLPVVPSCECSGWENNTDLWKDPPSVWTAHIPQRTNEPRDDGLFFKGWLSSLSCSPLLLLLFLLLYRTGPSSVSLA